MSRLYRILAINWQDITHPMGGGAEVHFHEIFKRVAAKGHEVTLLCCKYDGAADEETLDGIRIIRRGSRNRFNFHIKPAYTELAKEKQYDIVIDDINKIPFFTPLFVREPLLAIVHHFFGKSIFLEAPWLQAQYVYQTERRVPTVYQNTPFAVVSESTRRELRELGVKSSIELLPNSVDMDQFSVLPNEKSKIPLIGYFGRMKKYKSADHVLLALPRIRERIPNVRLLMIGGGDYLETLQEEAADLGIEDAVEFTGRVSHEDKVKLLNRLWLAVNPSPKEGWGLTVIEANACGVPVVAANSPGLRDSVRDGETGLLYPYGNIAALANSVVSLLQNTEQRKALAQNARHWAASWSWDDSARRAVEIIEKVVDSKQ